MHGLDALKQSCVSALTVQQLTPRLLCRRMQTFKEFMLQLPEEVMPDEAKTAYKQYQAEFWGSEIRADFELNKAEPW